MFGNERGVWSERGIFGGRIGIGGSVQERVVVVGRPDAVAGSSLYGSEKKIPNRGEL